MKLNKLKHLTLIRNYNNQDYIFWKYFNEFLDIKEILLNYNDSPTLLNITNHISNEIKSYK